MKFCDAGESSLGGNSFVKPKSDMGVKLEVFRVSELWGLDIWTQDLTEIENRSWK